MSDETYLREQAWNYFVLHASQRMTIFNFYLVSSSLIASAYFASSRLTLICRVQDRFSHSYSALSPMSFGGSNSVPSF